MVGSSRHLATPRGPREEELNISCWPPTVVKKVGVPRAKTPLERPSEGKFARALQNKNVSFINPQVDQFASKLPHVMKVGSIG